MGVSFGEYRDREFLVINGTSGKFLTARAHPKMILIEVRRMVLNAVCTFSIVVGDRRWCAFRIHAQWAVGARRAG